MRIQLLSLGAILALCEATPAQTVVSPGASAIQQNGDDLEEIVVTALKDRTDIQNTPAAVTVVSGQALEQLNIYNVLGIQNLVPSVRISEEGESFRLYIRGVGSLLDYYYVPETAAVNLNGTYLPRFATSGSLFDTESVQILPGPQGVLYGRSAGGGVLAINTNRPSNALEASGNIGYGNYDAVHFDGVGNVPINDQLALRAAVSFNKHDGYQSLGLDADDSSAIRLSALYTPTEALSTYVWATHFEQTGLPEAGQYLPYLPGHDPWYIRSRTR